MERSFAEVLKALAGGTMSRRQALVWIGATLAGAVLGRGPGAAYAAPGETSAGVPAQHGALLRGMDLVEQDRSLEGRFGLMFKELPAFEPPDELLTKLADAMNKDEEDDKDEEDEEGEDEEDEDEPRPRPPEFPIPAGFVFLGQFIDHDLTFDATPIPAQRQDPHALRNFRSARFELDSVYGAGPSQDSQFYDPADPAKLRIANLDNPKVPDDLPRDNAGRAIIGDPRDDENLVTSQLHLAFRKFHNRLVDHVREEGLSRTDEVFGEAQRLCRWHYQWMVLHDFLPKIVGHGVVNDVLQERANGPDEVKLSFYKPEEPDKPMMPIEFAVAAYRFGHSMLRPDYVINAQEEDRTVVLFGSSPRDSNLNGRRPIPPRLEIAWRHFFKIPGVDGDPVNRARPIDSNLAAPLFKLPVTIVPKPDKLVSLAKRNLLRGKRLGLASGQQVAQAMGAEVLSNKQLGLGDVPGWASQTQAPLWFYILKEAKLHENGERLGAVGGRIVAEVFLGLLKLDTGSYLLQDPTFTPEPPIAHRSGVFEIGDLLKFAGVA